MAPADEIKEQGVRFVRAGWRAVKVTAEKLPVPTGFAAGAEPERRRRRWSTSSSRIRRSYSIPASVFGRM